MKKGLSNVVTALIIILVSLVAIGIISLVVFNLIGNSSEGIGIGGLTVDVDIEQNSVLLVPSEETKNVSFSVKRNAGSGDVVGFKVVLTDGENSVNENVYGSLEELQTKKYSVSIGELDENLLLSEGKLTVAPIVEVDGKEKISNNFAEYFFSGDINCPTCDIIPDPVKPVVWLKFDGDLEDSSENNLDGIWGSAAQGTFVEGVRNNAVNVSGTASVKVLNNSLFNNWNQLTISFWMKKGTLSTSGFPVRKYVSSDDYYVRVGSNWFQGWVFNETGAGHQAVNWNVASINNLEWHQYVMVFDGTQIKLYVDPEANPTPVATQIFYGEQIRNSNNPILIDFEGVIDDLKIYNASLEMRDIVACEPGSVKNCDKQLGVCAGSTQVCDQYGRWPGCSDARYLSFNQNYKSVEGPVGAAVCSDGFDNDCDSTIDGNDLTCQDVYEINVRTGEEVLFEAEEILKYNNINDANWSWWYDYDFGDGIKTRPDVLGDSGGNVMSHFYTQEGSYEAVLTVQKPTIYNITTTNDFFEINTSVPFKMVGSYSVLVNVEGPYSKAFELWHADFNSRTSQWIYARLDDDPSVSYDNKITLDVSSHSNYRMVAEIKRDEGGYSKILFNENRALNIEEKFFLNNSELPKGNYTLTVKILNNGNVVEQINEYFEKDFDGAPKVGINENNAVVVDGELFFPVTPWLLDKSRIPTWANGDYINSLYAEGYYLKHDISTWEDYLDYGQSFGFYTIGPERFEGKAPRRFIRNSNVSMIKKYVEETKDHPYLLGWMWKDEPQLGGSHENVPPQVFRAWNYITHSVDNNHPFFNQMYGYTYMKYVGYSGSDGYNYLYNENLFGKKTHMSDVSGFDIYPLEYQYHPSLVDPDRGVMDLYAEGIDQFIGRNYDLIPVMSFVEVTDSSSAGRGTPPPTREQVRMEVWINVVHGIKGINWWHYFDPVPAENYLAMEEFKDQITRLTPIILGPDSDRVVTDNANVRAKRVDTLVKENATDLFIFAVRVTEPDTEWDELNGDAFEPENINVEFNVGGVSSGTVSVFDEGRTISLTGGKFNDNFEREAVHIYRIMK